jgi:two-component system cell cycle response regulator DivK
MANKVLCIEDNPNNMLLLKRVLDAWGYTQLQAENGLVGIRTAETEEIDLILLDINLPDIDGYEVIRRLRASEKAALAQIPIIVISANALVGDDKKALAVGCDAYLTKPIDIQELREAITAHMPTPNRLIG